MAVLHLVRHGQSGWNVQGRLQGQSTEAPGLTAAGRDQAWRAAEWLAEHAPDTDLIVTSDLLRTRQTAKIIAARLGVPVALDAGLREQGLGELEGECDMAAFERLWREPFRRPPGGGESVAHLYDRVHRTLCRLADERAGRSTVLVTHGGPVRIATTAGPLKPGISIPRKPIHNASVTSISLRTTSLSRSGPGTN
ncbi:MAG TPA: histidine phosphatase family protein [Pseudonocardiaceae bacterium]